MNHELFFEIGTEEIPAGYLQPALDSMRSKIAGKLSELDLAHGPIRVAATPRRLAITVSDLAARQPDRREEVLGPPKAAAYDTDNNPTKAATGFAASRGAQLADLQIAETPKGEYLMLIQEIEGQATETLLPSLLTDLLTELPFKKSMHWGTGRLHFARPIQWLLALYNGKVVEFTIDGGIASGASSRGHRFHAPQSFTVTSYDDYLQKLRQAKVLVDPEERSQAVVEEITQAVSTTSGKVLDDPELVELVTNLVEIPHAVCGNFDKRFLDLPGEALITSMREHQKYFAVVDEQGRLMPHFVAINNTRVKNSAVTTAGHERVLRARLEDGLFFFREDQGKRLADRVADLSGVIFQKKLGTMLEKTDRLVELAGFLASIVAPESEADVRRAAFLAKADLLTDMVGEFPSLQGVMGREYALLDKEKPEVAQAIHEHYLPVRAGSALPRGEIGALVGLADRLDSIAGCFGIGAVPTGSADPFGLRRLALGLLHIITDRHLNISLTVCATKALDLFGGKLTAKRETTLAAIIDFIKGRFTNDLTSKKIAVETVEAVTSVAFDDVEDCRMRIQALAAISAQPSFTTLAGSFKRVRNILKDHNNSRVDAALLAEPAEQALHVKLTETLNACEPLLAERRYDQALETILGMKDPVDGFFDDVMVMAEDPALRHNRLSLLAAVSELFLKVGDFSKMYAIQSKP